MMTMAELHTRVVVRRVTWSASRYSNSIDVREANTRLQLELGDDFAGATVAYYAVDAEGNYVPLYKNGTAVTETVTASARNVLSADLLGIDELVIQSDQTETCEGRLFGAAS